jgi:hypothetical protein
MSFGPLAFEPKISSVGDGEEHKHKRGVSRMREVDWLVGGRVVGRSSPKQKWWLGWQEKKLNRNEHRKKNSELPKTKSLREKGRPRIF